MQIQCVLQDVGSHVATPRDAATKSKLGQCLHKLYYNAALLSGSWQYIKRPASPVVLFEPSGSKFFCFWSCDWNNVHVHVASSQMAHLWLSVKIVSGCTVLFGSRVINCSQEETFGNLLSRLENKFSESDFFSFFLFTGHPGLLCD